ncbi:MAG: ATP-binding cassette domain-containing protein, partial [Thermoguttaceae bacterium]|nr:ATP-binding cassette domain-containing protein [Thermoguttaceae bacterium]
HIHAIFPLGVLCLVTGVSGSGKSTLIEETLYRALARHRGNSNVPAPLPYDRILGADQIDDVILVDQLPIGRSPRSNPATYLKIFDDIRNVFAETPEAKSKGYGAGYFSFNVDGGRCNTCKGEGFLTIDMQFMADMFVKCPQCGGKRYQQEILNVLYRGRNIAEVLNMTVHEAFTFFRNNSKIQQKLKNLKDVGLEYLRLGQPANTLSGGESQRLKLAAYLQTTKKGRCLFLMDEPTTGLHFADNIQLLNSFNHLLEIGHSLVIIEHNTQMMMAADYIVDLGPGAGEAGGQIVAEGTPEQVARCAQSATGRCLAELLKR